MSVKRVYVLIAEKALGHSQPLGALVHHVDEDRSNNKNSNLVILQSVSEHAQLHRRLRIKQAGGNPWTQQICCTCRAVKDLCEYPPSKRRYSSECLPCASDRNNARYHASNGNPARRLTREERVEIGRQMANRRWHPHLERPVVRHL
jgi:hypothetical protein